jgi:CubicO group peptidase (beta-lactamase class C family)
MFPAARFGEHPAGVGLHAERPPDLLGQIGRQIVADGTQVLPEDWMRESTAPSKGYWGYGYFWWLLGDGVFRASGIFGQGIYINPAEDVVIAMHSAREVASNRPDWELQIALFSALTSAGKE